MPQRVKLTVDQNSLNDGTTRMSEHLFSGLKVLDVAAVIAAPVAAMILADFGADVIKVEAPSGDMLRTLSNVPTTPDTDNNYFWHMDGRNKRAITLDLKSPEGIGVLHKLIAECDVYITNQPFPVRRSLKLEYKDVKSLNPRMIYASLSAYGEEGPEKDGKGFDLVAYWARSGLMDLVRDPEGRPAQSLPGMGDHPTGVALYAAIATALIHRERTGEGSMVGTSLLANGLWSAASIAGGAWAGGDMETYHERKKHPPVFGAIYEASDGRFLQFTMVRTDEEIDRFFHALGLAHLLEDVRFNSRATRAENREELVRLIREVTETRTSVEWLVILEDAGVPANRVPKVEETLQDEQITANKMAVAPASPDLKMPYLVNHPLKVDVAPQVEAVRAPDPGEHTDAILDELGYTAEEIKALRGGGAVG
ncbi:MAG: hypothetical protein CMQ05_17820 [Gammaproteobacteria bacterium]|nr:hypothetical protein [Gammaproteobacteria bacterium]|tara:strand:- start:4551 stop:5819 length:1269 start_codon:yes stop_codon:yes gene_type:complete